MSSPAKLGPLILHSRYMYVYGSVWAVVGGLEGPRGPGPGPLGLSLPRDPPSRTLLTNTDGRYYRISTNYAYPHVRLDHTQLS